MDSKTFTAKVELFERDEVTVSFETRLRGGAWHLMGEGVRFLGLRIALWGNTI
jgi:hypothetical protein